MTINTFNNNFLYHSLSNVTCGKFSCLQTNKNITLSFLDKIKFKRLTWLSSLSYLLIHIDALK